MAVIGLLVPVLSMGVAAHQPNVVSDDEASSILGGCYEVETATQCNGHQNCCHTESAYRADGNDPGTEQVTERENCSNDGTCDCGTYGSDKDTCG
jgi:hypothetical protein